MKLLIAGAFTLLLAMSANAQQTAPPVAAAPPPACLTQYTQTPGQSASSMILAGYEIKTAVPGGLWLQKGKEVYYCNSGRPTETEALCWRLREPGPC